MCTVLNGIVFYMELDWPLTHTFFARKFWVGVGALKVLAANKRENICPKFGQVYFREGEFRSN